MIGKASEIKTKVLYSRTEENPNWNASNPAAERRYLFIDVNESISVFFSSIPDATIIDIQFKPAKDHNDSDSAFIIYKEATE